MKIIFTPKFIKQYSKLSCDIQDLTDEKIQLFQKEPFNTSLKTHKLHGELCDFYSFSVNYQYRIVFRFEEKTRAVLIRIGRHDIYD